MAAKKAKSEESPDVRKNGERFAVDGVNVLDTQTKRQWGVEQMAKSPLKLANATKFAEAMNALCKVGTLPWERGDAEKQ